MNGDRAARGGSGRLFVQLDGERLDDLNRGGLMILQKAAGFRFGTDSVLLADFAAPKRGERAADLGAGGGILSILMADAQPHAFFDAIEWQADMCDMARRSAAGNGLDGRLRVHHLDVRRAPEALGYGGHSLIVCNPPYNPRGAAPASEEMALRLARHECESTVEDFITCASALLKNGGRAAFIYPAPRAFDLMAAMRGRRLEPKRIRLIQDRPGAKPKLILLDAVKGAGSMLDWLPPLILRGEDGAPSPEYRRIYRMPLDENGTKPHNMMGAECQ
jgi:tRNA1Val (adenine37-N6)-methyltransferase